MTRSEAGSAELFGGDTAHLTLRFVLREKAAELDHNSALPAACICDLSIEASHYFGGIAEQS